ncbi:MAG: class I SAM-dependent methyltransferase [Burkholderiales bacterium]|jgi:cyclopropane-fatty-acyl-phospholipid synthase|nr:class I SAM-dependent methyltransferase [Burkholderiales bacterium]
MNTELALSSPAAGGGTLDASSFPSSARWALRMLDRFSSGTLELTFPDGQRARFGAGSPQAHIRLHNWAPIQAALSSGDIGFAESFVSGDWSTDDPVRVLKYFVRNRDAAESMIYGSFWGGLAYRLRHWFNRNTREQAKRNIHAHYDLGNAFYALWLDPTMTYSGALFEQAPTDPHAPADEQELAAAQRAKYRRVLDELRLAPGSRVLEIGCGWGGFAETAARAGHLVKGLTLSAAQLHYAQARLERQDLPGELVLQDYRDEREQFDGIASIEMFEAVGEAYWPSYFATLARCLKPGGRACVQTIEIADRLFDRYRRSSDFIQQYVFPGGMLPSPSEFRRQAARAGLRVAGAHSFGSHYARTLASWRTRFLARLAAVRAQGFDERFLRIWHFYLAYCEAAFAEGNTDVTQYTLEKA